MTTFRTVGFIFLGLTLLGKGSTWGANKESSALKPGQSVSLQMYTMTRYSKGNYYVEARLLHPGQSQPLWQKKLTLDNGALNLTSEMIHSGLNNDRSPSQKNAETVLVFSLKKQGKKSDLSSSFLYFAPGTRSDPDRRKYSIHDLPRGESAVRIDVGAPNLGAEAFIRVEWGDSSI